MVNPNVDNSGSHDNDETSVTTDNSQNDDGLEKDAKDSDQVNWQKRYSDSSREAAKLRESNEINSAYRQVLKDQYTALDLNPKIADKVVEELYNDGFCTVKTWSELVDILKNWTAKEKKEVLDEKQITEKVKQELKEEAETEKALAIKEELLGKLSNEMRKKVEEEFEEVLGNRKLTTSFTERELKKIITYYRKESWKDDEALAKAATNSMKWKWSTKSTGMTIEKLTAAGLMNTKAQKEEAKRLYPELFKS